MPFDGDGPGRADGTAVIAEKTGPAIMARQAVLAKGKDPVGTDGDAQAAAAALCPVDGNGGATIHITPFPLEKNPYPR